MPTDVGAAGDDLFLSHRSYGPLQDTEARVESGRDQLRSRRLRSLAYYVMGGRYLVGKTFTMADIVVGVALQYTDFRYPHDWRERAPILDKLKEEIGELTAEIDAGAPKAK